MRLLDFSHDQVRLTRDFTNNAPPYAILSHTWGEDDQEVTFQDLMQGVGKSKAGYEKIRFCRKQAATNGLQYVWIDTCCIDKSNSPNSRRLSTPCFAGTVTRLNAMCTCQTFRRVAPGGNQLFGRVDGLLEAGPFKSFLLQDRSFSSQERANHLATRLPSSNKSARLPRSLSMLSKENLCLLSPLTRGCHGHRSEKPSVRKIRHILLWAFSAYTCRLSMARGRRRRSNGSSGRSRRGILSRKSDFKRPFAMKTGASNRSPNLTTADCSSGSTTPVPSQARMSLGPSSTLFPQMSMPWPSSEAMLTGE
jgi:hypothetical protein